MKVSIKLYEHKDAGADGFPVVVIARHKNKQPEKRYPHRYMMK